MMILLIIVLSIPLLWLIGFLAATDFSVPVKNARQFHHVLAIFPHADDEAVTCGGTLHHISAAGSEVTLALLTGGEKGPNATRSVNLKELRMQEARTAAGILGIARLFQEDFGDGALQQKKRELRMFIAALIEREQPDLLITYDLAGFYGHPDHIACSEIVTELKQTSFPQIPLWYVTFPERVLARVRLPDSLASDPAMQAKRAYPTHKLFIGTSVFPKIKAWYTYKSQRVSLARGIGAFVPIWLLWFFLSVVLFEYFAEAR
jgi:LmbE family N-acetylglucosaminyl deacetylase